MVVGHINGVVALTGFSYEEMYGRFAGTKKVVVITRWSYYRGGRIIEVVVRRGSTVLFIAELRRPEGPPSGAP